MSEAIIRVENLVFEYPTTRALKGLDFTIAPKTITALVGPNGAGKTTLLRCLAALEQPLVGRIEVDGLDLETAPREIHSRMGYLSDFFGLYDGLSVERCLLHRAAAQGLPPDGQRPAALKAAERTGLSDRLQQKAGELSRGLRQRLAIAQSILHEPKLLLLDEPASGLDPEARAELSRLLLTLRDQGMTLIVSSHILSELEDYSSDIMILRGGKIMEHRSLDATPSADTRVTVAIELSQADTRLAGLIQDQAGWELTALDGRKAKVTLPASQQQALLKTLVMQGLPVLSYAALKPDLQDAYLAHLRESGQ